MPKVEGETWRMKPVSKKPGFLNLALARGGESGWGRGGG
jgi:hypothetical protein